MFLWTGSIKKRHAFNPDSNIRYQGLNFFQVSPKIKYPILIADLIYFIFFAVKTILIFISIMRNHFSAQTINYLLC